MRVTMFLQRTLLLLALCCPFIAPPLAQAQSEEKYVPGEIVIKLFNSADLTAVANQYRLALPPLDQFWLTPHLSLAYHRWQ